MLRLKLFDMFLCLTLDNLGDKNGIDRDNFCNRHLHCGRPVCVVADKAAIHQQISNTNQ